MKVYLVLGLSLIALTLSGCGSVVPPGKTVILLHPDGKTDTLTKGVYKAWGRTRVYFVDGKLKSFSETMKVLMADDINMDIDVKVLMSFDVSPKSIDFIKSKVPTRQVTSGDVSGYELSLDEFYALAVRDVVRSSSRNIISPYITDDVRPNRQKIESVIQENVINRVSSLKYPLQIGGILLSNIDYPQSVKDMRQRIKKVSLEEQEKDAKAKAAIAEARRQVEVQAEIAKAKIVKAKATAAENSIIIESLSPEYLMWRQYEVMEKIAGHLGAGGNNTVFMMPYQMMSPELLNASIVREKRLSFDSATD